MGATEIILIVIGVVVFLLGYLMPARKKDIDEEVQLISEDEIRKLISGEVEHVKDRIADIVDEAVSYSIEKTERAMERLTNEKIMAINEYSDTVLEEINKSHKEVVFLYDMLNDKQEKLMATVNEATTASDEIKQTLTDAEGTVLEATDKADDVLRAVDEASARINDVLRAADDAVKGVWDAQNAARVAREAAQEAIRIASVLTGSAKAGMGVSSDSQVSRKETSTGKQQTQRTAASGNGGSAAGTFMEENAAVPAAAKDVPRGDVSDEREFRPITPKRVEIIHEPDEDSAEERPEQTAKGRPGLRQDFADMESMGDGAEEGTQETMPMVDLQFAKDNGRNSNERILELHKAGKSNMAIAKELGLGLGEVKLVIDLFEGM